MELGKYELYEELGRGGYGTVYRALDTTLEVERAVKVLHPVLAADMGFIERFKREARIAARLEHPHIVPVYEIDEQDGRYYLVMKYMTGGSLKYRLEKDGPLAYEMARGMICQVGQALDFAHQKGLVHRDVKPGNILLDVEGGVRLADFGFAKAMQAASSASLSVTGGMAGTPAYMAPELWSGKEAGPGTDLYSLACVFYEMLVGKALFAGETPPEVIKQHIMDRPRYPVQWPQGVPPGIEKVLERALAKEQGERYPAVREFLDELQGLESGKEQAIHQDAAVKAVTEKVEKEQGWVKCEVCGRVYDAGSMTSCPYCRLQGADESIDGGRQEEGNKPVYPVKPVDDRERKSTPTLKKSIIEGITVLFIIFGFFILYLIQGEERNNVQDELEATDKPWVTRTSRLTETRKATNTPRATSTPEFRIGSTIVSEKDGMEMVYVPAGEFQMGDQYYRSSPQHGVYLDAFWLDKYEVTNAQYEKCVVDGSCKESIYKDNDLFNKENQPVVGMSWSDATAYCEWVDRRLPSEAEWEKAASGRDNRKYPWGNENDTGDMANIADVNIYFPWANKKINDGYAYTAPVGSYTDGASSYGALDMAGNALEWVNDWYDIDYYEQSPSRNPQGPQSGEKRIVRGGSWANNFWGVTDRDGITPDERNYKLGFRCALTAD